VSLVTFTRWYRTKCPMHFGHFMIYCAPNLSSHQSKLIHHRSLLRLQKTPIIKAGEYGREMTAAFCLPVSVIYLERSLLCCRILRHGAHSSPPSKEVVLQIFIALKIYCPWRGLNQPTWGPLASTIPISPQRPTRRSVRTLNYITNVS
jgi:hypothetical protein